MTSSRVRTVGILAVMLFLASAYFYQDPGWNGNSRLDLTRAIVERGTFQIDAYQSDRNWATEDRAFFGGHYYSDKGIGPSMLATPFYFLLHKIAQALRTTPGSALIKHGLTAIILGAAFTFNGVAMFLVAYQITQRSWQALVPTLAVSLGTMLWPYSAVFYGHVLAAALLMIGFYLLFSKSKDAESITYTRLFWVGLMLGFAFITEYSAALIIAGLGVYAVLILRRRQIWRVIRSGIAAFLGALIPLSIMGAYNWHIYGTPWTIGYAHEAENQFQGIVSSGLLGVQLPSLVNTYRITLDSQIGLFWQSPVLLLGLLGFFYALRNPRYRAEGLLCLYSIGVIIAMNGGVWDWWAGSAFGPRYLIPCLPFFIVPLALLPQSMLWVTALLGSVSCAQMLIPLMGQIQTSRLVFRIHPNMFYIEDAPFRGFSVLYNYGLPQILRQYEAGTSPWTLGSALGLPFWLSVPALIVAEVGLAMKFLQAEGSRKPPAQPEPPADGG